MEITVKRKNYRKMVPCDVCGKSMRSDNLKRHRLVHKDLRPENKERVEQEQFERELLQTHLNKIELGRNISEIIGKGVVQEESLNKERQQGLRLYRKHKPRTQANDDQDIINVN